jgi:ubiquitin carboxyl-terminal hydrolase 34
MGTGADDTGTRISVESESDALSTIPPIATPSSSPSPIGSPQVELVTICGDDSDFNNDDLPVTIINEDAVYLDPMANFPYFAEGETLVNTVSRVARFLQYGTCNQTNLVPHHLLTPTDEINNDDSFCKIRDWIESYLFTNSQMDSFYELYAKHREFWGVLPDLIWALSYRRSVSFLRVFRDIVLILKPLLRGFSAQESRGSPGFD